MNDAILVTYESEDAINEAVALCNAAGYTVRHVMTQKFLKRPRYGISKEGTERLEEAAERIDASVIVYDEVLKPSQNYNLASKLHRDILDREALILEIFEGRASSAESKLQVRLAKMRYEMSRAKEKVRLAKMGEQPGFMGIGKFEVDVYYNDIRKRMHTVKARLEKTGRQRDLHRRGRKRAGFRTVSLAGYTSAGKTTLFNAMTGEEKECDSGLFTTLSTTTRRVRVNRRDCLVSDTVGFISKLPAYMIEAFRSTLEDLLYADVILLVADASDAPAEFRKKLRSSRRTLIELGAPPDRIVLVLNKSDLLGRGEIAERIESLGRGERAVAVSAMTGHNVDLLMEMIDSMLAAPDGPAIAKEWERR